MYPFLWKIFPPFHEGLSGPEPLWHLAHTVELPQTKVEHLAQGFFLDIARHLGHFLCLLDGVNSLSHVEHTVVLNFIIKFYQ
jgi:hypothetical protein